MKVRLFCEKCDAAIDLASEALRGPAAAACPECKAEHKVDPDAELIQGRPPRRCAACGHEHFHRRKQFPRRLGLAMVLIAAVLCFVPIFPPQLFFLPLIIASLVDLGLYAVLPWKGVCYVCDAEYSGPVREDLEPYDLAAATEHQKLRRRRPAAR